MKVKVATRSLNEAYFMAVFLGDYLSSGVDEVHVFDSGSKDGTLEIVEAWRDRTDSVELVLPPGELQHTGQDAEGRLCNYMLQYALRDYDQDLEESWWLFPDVDEFVRPPSSGLRPHLEASAADILRAVCIDWYLPPERAREDLPAEEVLRLARQGRLKGRFSDLWKDPFYKDCVLRVNAKTAPAFRHLETVSGFHRFILRGRLYLPSNENYVVVDHLRGIPLRRALDRLKFRLSRLKEKDDWAFVHFQLVLDQLRDYDRFFRTGLHSATELEGRVRLAQEYDNRNSFPNNVIIREHLQEPRGSRLSRHGLTGGAVAGGVARNSSSPKVSPGEA